MHDGGSLNFGGDINIFLIYFSRARTIEKWYLSLATNLPVTGVIPKPNVLVSTKMQEVFITRIPANIAQPGTYTVTGGHLVLEFQSLYLREISFLLQQSF